MRALRTRWALLCVGLMLPFAVSAQLINVGPGQLCTNPIPVIQANLLGYAEGYTAARGFLLGGGAEFDFSRAMGRAASEISVLRGVDCDRKVAEVHVNTQRYVDAMIDASRTIPGYPSGRIGEQTFALARNRLCPIWPFCF